MASTRCRRLARFTEKQPADDGTLTGALVHHERETLLPTAQLMDI